MTGVFEDKFMDAQSSLMSLCLELINEHVDYVFAYILIKNDTRYFNAFFKRGKDIFDAKQVSESEELTANFFRLSAEDVESIVSVCNEYGRQCPVQFKMVYEVFSGKYNVDFIYEEEEIIGEPEELFNKWKCETKKLLDRQLSSK